MYRLSVLPNESILDCLTFEKGQSETELLVCCASGSYVILKKLSSIMYQEVWRFKGFSQPPKGLILCDPMKVLALEAQSLALIDLRKKDISPYNPRSEDVNAGVGPK